MGSATVCAAARNVSDAENDFDREETPQIAERSSPLPGADLRRSAERFPSHVAGTHCCLMRSRYSAFGSSPASVFSARGKREENPRLPPLKVSPRHLFPELGGSCPAPRAPPPPPALLPSPTARPSLPALAPSRRGRGLAAGCARGAELSAAPPGRGCGRRSALRSGGMALGSWAGKRSLRQPGSPLVARCTFSICSLAFCRL